jgi:integrase
MKEYKDYGYLTRAITLPNGKRKYFRATTKRELDRKVLEFQIAQAQGKIVVDTAMTVTELATMWLEQVKKPAVKPQSYGNYENLMKYHLLPAIGEMRVCEVKPIHIINVLNSHGYSTKDANRRLLVGIRSLFRFAVDNDLITKSPVPDRMSSPGEPVRDDTPLTPNQSKMLLEYCAKYTDPNLYTFTLLALTTGMRRGEIAALRWDCVDFQTGTVRVRRQLIELTNTVTEDLKTAAARREIPIPPYVAAHLRRVHALTTSTYVVTGSHDGHTDGNDFARFARQWNKAGVVPFKIHAHLFRKTFATRLIEAGTDPKRVQYLLGHTNLEMTLGVYAKYDAESQREATRDVIDKTFSGYIAAMH